ncbi:hypothetical protein AAFF_G00213180 [Aldrovandia affinis]|uniref:Uncharacterized protein n=1 Tax=Aldrovandia affinis TaxID=143900 RepID=A0AAD7RGT4_9TELE|nr:hypothetical protein AAFF_G00213180 [Aldrovandia affinis]
MPVESTATTIHLNMDVSLSVTLLREQMGTVIEQAVSAAVETVLGEMAKVVGCKLEECSKEMSAKEKENESIKQMLEVSQCQIKTMRKYLSAVIAKDDRHVLMSQRNVRKQNESNRICRAPAGETQPFRGIKRTVKEGDGTVTVSRKAQNALTQSPAVYPSEGLAQVASSCDRLATKSPSPRELAQESASRQGSEDSFDTTIPRVSREASELAHMKEECRGPPEVENGSQAKADECEPVWVAKQRTTAQDEGPVNLDPGPQSPPLGTSVAAAAEASASTVWDAPVRAKEEEAEIEIICIKEEPEELEPYPLNPQCASLGVDLGGAPDGDRPPGSEASLTAVTSFMYGQRSQTGGGQRPARWRHRMREPSLYEEHKHHKAELKRRSQHRRREREKSLPQPLLAALERERREKNRIRVARWRAKRKMQAGLVPSQPAQFGYPPTQTVVHIQHGDKLHCHPPYGAAAPPAGSLLYNSGAQCEQNSALYSSLQFTSNPLLPGLRHDT